MDDWKTAAVAAAVPDALVLVVAAEREVRVASVRDLVEKLRSSGV